MPPSGVSTPLIALERPLSWVTTPTPAYGSPSQLSPCAWRTGTCSWRFGNHPLLKRPTSGLFTLLLLFSFTEKSHLTQVFFFFLEIIHFFIILFFCTTRTSNGFLGTYLQDSIFLFNIATTHHTWQLDTSHAILNQICGMKNGTKWLKIAYCEVQCSKARHASATCGFFFSLCSKRKQRLRLNYWTEGNGTFSPGIKKNPTSVRENEKKIYVLSKLKQVFTIS